jgi:selenium metabolism protein YedF
MPKTVDARGLACPKPVIETRAALAENDVVITIVDNEISRNNVSRMAESKGCTVEAEERDGDFYLTIRRGESVAEEEPSPPSESAGSGGPLVVVLGSDELGSGAVDLGHLLMRTFLDTLAKLEQAPATLVCFNTGVLLAVGQAETVGPLRALESAGARVLVCGTCLKYFNVEDKLAVGEISNMLEIVEALTGAGTVLSP